MTNEQFWEQCGFYQIHFLIPADKVGWWLYPNSKEYCPSGELPPTDFNNLSKYAFPLLWQKGVVEIDFGKDFCYLDYGYGQPFILEVGDKLEDNLLEAIYKALGGKE